MRRLLVCVALIIGGLNSGCSSSTETVNSGPNASLSGPGLVDFGMVKVGYRKDTTISLQNTGADTLSISSHAFGAPQFSLVDPTQSAMRVAPSSTVSVKLRFIPTDTASLISADTIHSNGKQSAVTIPLHGGGIAALRIVTLPATFDFGNVSVGTCLEDTLSISNSGNDTLQVSAVAASPSDFTVTKYPSAVAPGVSAQILVRFCATAVGTKNGSVTVVSNATNSVAPIQISAKGAQYEAKVNNSYLYEDRALDSNYQPTGPTVSAQVKAIAAGLTYRGVAGVVGFKEDPSTFSYSHLEPNGDVSYYFAGFTIDSVKNTVFGNSWWKLPFGSHSNNVPLFTGDTDFTVLVKSSQVEIKWHLVQNALYYGDTSIMVAGKPLSATTVRVVTTLTTSIPITGATNVLQSYTDFSYAPSIGYVARTESHNDGSVVGAPKRDGKIRTLVGYTIY